MWEMCKDVYVDSNSDGADGSEGRKEFANGLVMFRTEPVANGAEKIESSVNYGNCSNHSHNTD